MISGEVINKTNPSRSYSFKHLSIIKKDYEENIRALFKGDVIEIIWEKK